MDGAIVELLEVPVPAAVDRVRIAAIAAAVAYVDDGIGRLGKGVHHGGVREVMVSSRTAYINTVRGWLRGQGLRIRGGVSETFAKRVREAVWPPAFVEVQPPFENGYGNTIPLAPVHHSGVARGCRNGKVWDGTIRNSVRLGELFRHASEPRAKHNSDARRALPAPREESSCFLSLGKTQCGG